jgi:hypothetical protein
MREKPFPGIISIILQVIIGFFMLWGLYFGVISLGCLIGGTP